MMSDTSVPATLDGAGMHALARRLWPLHRSLTGDGTRQTLRVIQEVLPGLTLHEVPSGTQVFDWTIPAEWTIRSATLTGPGGEIVVDYADSNLHVVGYSIPVDVTLDLEELQEHLYSIPEQPDAVPYVTSYYNPRWGFCLSHEERLQLKAGEYRARIDSTLEPGSLTYGELILPGESTDEIFISTYVCHPSLANNELSGPMVAAALASYISSLPRHHYTYRFAFTPESIGAIAYADRNLEVLRRNVVAAINLSCIGDDRAYTYLASRHGNLRIDRAAKRAIRSRENVREYSYLGRGSDERHYGAPGVDLPMISLMRSRYADYPEYHTSLDDLENVVTPSGLQGGFDLVREVIDAMESEPVLVTTVRGEPQLGKRGLYHTVQKKTTPEDVMLRTNVLAYADGHHTISDMVELFDTSLSTLRPMVDELIAHGLLYETHESPRVSPGMPA
jgi:aminopeptidase-like protein